MAHQPFALVAGAGPGLGQALMRRLGFEVCARPDGVNPLYGSTGFPEKIGALLLRHTILADWETAS